MENKICIFYFLLFTCFSYGQQHKFVPEIKAILSQDNGEKLIKQCSRFSVENVQSFFNVSENEVSDLETNFKKIYTIQSTKCCLKGQKVSNLKYYGYQYVGLIIKDAKYIYINAFELETSQILLKSGEWQIKPVVMCDGGSSYWGVLYNIKKKKFMQLSMNGSI